MGNSLCFRSGVGKLFVENFSHISAKRLCRETWFCKYIQQYFNDVLLPYIYNAKICWKWYLQSDKEDNVKICQTWHDMTWIHREWISSRYAAYSSLVVVHPVYYIHTSLAEIPRTQYKLGVSVRKALIGTAPNYIKDCEFMLPSPSAVQQYDQMFQITVD